VADGELEDPPPAAILWDLVVQVVDLVAQSLAHLALQYPYLAEYYLLSLEVSLPHSLDRLVGL